jgi:hypothetical protein
VNCLIKPLHIIESPLHHDENLKSQIAPAHSSCQDDVGWLGTQQNREQSAQQGAVALIDCAVAVEREPSQHIERYSCSPAFAA